MKMPNEHLKRRVIQQDHVIVIQEPFSSISSHNGGPSGPNGIIPNVIEGALRQTAQRRKAEEEINQKWNSLNSAPGLPKVPGEDGLISSGDGYYREYIGGGRIYYNQSTSAFWVHGLINDKYTQLGGPGSWLGWPTSDELLFTQDGRVSTFQNGAIYWWPDTGAIELGDISLRYTGLYCFGETDESTTSDEPYVIIGVVPAIVEKSVSKRTRVYGEDDDPFGNVDAGDSREDNIELYRGRPYGLSLTAVLMERDLGDPDKYRDTVKAGVEKASEIVGVGVGFVPIVGPLLAPAAEAFLKAVGPDIVNGINDLLGTENDHIGTISFDVSAKDMVRLTRVERQNLKGILWHIDSPLISDGEASYKIYIDIQAV